MSSIATPRTKQQVVAEFRSTEILDAARKVFSKKGFSKVTVDEIADEAKLSKATVYQYFNSKQEIYFAALSQGVRELAEHSERQLSKTSDGIRTQIEGFIRARLEFLHQNRDFFAVYHAEFGNLIHPASLNEELRKLYRRQVDALQAVLQDALDRGELSGISAETLATVIVESIRGLMLRRNLGWSSATVDDQVSTLMRILWDGACSSEVKHVDR